MCIHTGKLVFPIIAMLYMFWGLAVVVQVTLPAVHDVKILGTVVSGVDLTQVSGFVEADT